jgi:hypothetical protein
MSPTSPLSQLPIWQAVVAVLVPAIGLVAWLAVLGARVQTLELELTGTAARIEALVERHGNTLDDLKITVAEQGSDLRWLRQNQEAKR